MISLKIHPPTRESKPEANLFRDFLRLCYLILLCVTGWGSLNAHAFLEKQVTHVLFMRMVLGEPRFELIR